MGFARVTILLQFLDIFVTQSRTRRWYIIWTLIVINLIFLFAMTIVGVLECVPRSKILNPKVPGRCVSLRLTVISNSVLNLGTDFTTLFLPLFWIWKLHTNLKKKIYISVIFGAGAL